MIAATIASVIQYRQWKLGKDKLRYDLFEKRAAIYRILFSDIKTVDGDNENQIKVIQAVLESTDFYWFLFPDNLCQKIESSRNILMIIISELKIIPHIHPRVTNYWHKFFDVRSSYRAEMLSLVKFED